VVVAALAVVVLVAAGVGAYLLLRGSSGPTSAERATCAAMQDFVDDIHASNAINVLEADAKKVGETANRGSNLALAAHVRKLRTALATFEAGGDSSEFAYRPVVSAYRSVALECRSVGASLH
jgi:hypothetical protein